MMHVHVPKTRQQEFSGGVDGARSFGDFDFCSFPHSGDAPGVNQDSLIWLRWAAGGIDERYMRNCKLRRRLRRWRRWHDEESQRAAVRESF